MNSEIPIKSTNSFCRSREGGNPEPTSYSGRPGTPASAGVTISVEVGIYFGQRFKRHTGHRMKWRVYFVVCGQWLLRRTGLCFGSYDRPQPLKLKRGTPGT